MSIHRIRLQGPWEVLPPGQNSNDWEPVRLPASWRELFGQSAGTARFRRKFNSPTGLEPNDRLVVRIPADVGTVEEVTVNGAPLPPLDDPGAFDATRPLREGNLLEVQISFDPANAADIPGGLWQPLVLEIHSPDVS